MSKDKTLKKAYTFKPKVNESPEIIQFLIEQTNFNDAIRYLIEKEIAENGIRDIVQFIPSVRNINNLNTEPFLKKAPVDSSIEDHKPLDDTKNKVVDNNIATLDNSISNETNSSTIIKEVSATRITPEEVLEKVVILDDNLKDEKGKEKVPEEKEPKEEEIPSCYD